MARNRESTSTPADAQANTEQAEQTQGEAVTGTTETASTPVGTATAGAGATTAAEAKTDNRHKLVTLNEDTAPKFGGPVGQAVKRAEYIRKRWRDDHIDRGSIKKEINSMGDNSTYQIIFAATKKIPGGPQKTAAGAEQATAASQSPDALAEQKVATS
jgi:hypothetical protein